MFQQSLDNFKAAIEMSLGIAVLETLLASIIYLFEIYCGFSRTVLIHEQNFCQLNIINTKCITHIRPNEEIYEFYQTFWDKIWSSLPYFRFNWINCHTQIGQILKIISFLFIFHGTFMFFKETEIKWECLFIMFEFRAQVKLQTVGDQIK